MTDDFNQYELMMEAYAELKPEIERTRKDRGPLSPTPFGSTQDEPAQPTLSRVLADFGPMPDEALFLGVASDELPVLLNLHDPIPGPLLIIGEPGAGKTALLQTIASAAGQMHQPEQLQFGALTNHPEEWNGFEEIQNNVGVFPINQKSAEDFVISLASWAHGNKSSRQSILLLLDDLEAINNMDEGAVRDLRWLLFRGPSRRVWPIITLSTQHLIKMTPWLDSFRTQIFGRVQNPHHINKLSAARADLESLESGSEFALREGKRWLRFWIPTLD